MKVKIMYQPFEENMAIFIDGQPLGHISALTKYQSSSFVEWCGSIMPAIAEEVNDCFDLIYCGREIEYKLLKQIFAQYKCCTSLQYEEPCRKDSALVRLKKLSRLVMNGVDCPKYVAPLHIYTDMPEEDVRESMKKILPKLSFCTVSVFIHSVDTPGKDTDRKCSIALLSEKYDMASIQPFLGETVGVVAIGNDPFCCMRGTIVMMSNMDTLQDLLMDLLELVYYPLLLKDALSKVNVQDSDPNYADIIILDKMEPCILAKLPKSIEFGQTAPIPIKTIPESGKDVDIRVRISNETVLAYTPNGLKAVGTGEAVVEIYEVGKTVPLTTATIIAYRTNHIQKLKISPEQMQICVGDVCSIKKTFLPSDADNVSKIALISEDGATVGIQNQDTIIGRRPGRCAIFYEAQSVQSAKCSVYVYPRLESLTIKMGNTFIRQNEFTDVKILREPVDATLDNLMVQIEPAGLGTYEKGSGRFFAREAGRGNLIVYSDRSDVKAMIPIEVMRKTEINLIKLLKYIGIVILIILAWCFLQKFL